MKEDKYEIHTKDKKTKKEVTMTLGEWQEVSILCEDNIRFQENYIPEYLGMLKTFDALLWRTDIVNFKAAKSLWDYIKFTFFPNWLIERFPAKYISIDIRCLYPQLSKFPNKIKMSDIKKTKKFIVSSKKENVYFPGCITW